MSAPKRQLISVLEAADRLHVSGKTIRRYVAAGRLTAYRVGAKLLRLDAAEVDALARPVQTVRFSGDAA